MYFFIVFLENLYVSWEIILKFLYFFSFILLYFYRKKRKEHWKKNLPYAAGIGRCRPSCSCAWPEHRCSPCTSPWGPGALWTPECISGIWNKEINANYIREKNIRKEMDTKKQRTWHHHDEGLEGYEHQGVSDWNLEINACIRKKMNIKKIKSKIS